MVKINLDKEALGLIGYIMVIWNCPGYMVMEWIGFLSI